MLTTTTDIPDSFTPNSRASWRNWLQKNYADKDFVWLIYNKKNSGLPTIAYSDAVDEALCFGWIDSKQKSIDENRSMQYFCKRKPNSVWSKVNKAKVEALIAQKLMTEAGLACIDIAKANGSWTILDEVEALVIPADLEKAFTKKGRTFFELLSRTDKRNVLQWLVLAKREETRIKRIAEIVTLANQNLKPKQFTKI
jgi:uncharacterized protein YdeI (YjbR/CyaY-like superfamily)